MLGVTVVGTRAGAQFAFVDEFVRRRRVLEPELRTQECPVRMIHVALGEPFARARAQASAEFVEEQEALVPLLGAGMWALYGLLSSGPVVAFLLLFGGLLLLYKVGLDAPAHTKWLLPGTLLASLAIGVLGMVMELMRTWSKPGKE